MTLEEAAKILTERKHRGHSLWVAEASIDGQERWAEHSGAGYDVLGEFEAIAVAEKYLRIER